MAQIMAARPDDRSQPILRMPRDKTPAELILDDGERSYILLFVVPGDRLSLVFEGDSQFMPVIAGTTTRLIARRAIACVTVHVMHAQVEDNGIPQERQQALVRLRGGASVRGELRWVAAPDRRRTLDHLNDETSHLMLWESDYIHYVAKAAVIHVEEV